MPERWRNALAVNCLNYNYMNENRFRMCIDCANKQSIPQLQNDMYYCPYVQGILPKGIVYYDTDATECVRNGVFREIK